MDDRLRELQRRALASGLAHDIDALHRARELAGLVPRVGLVFLDDLGYLGIALGDRAVAWRKGRDLDGPLLPPSLMPPPVLVAVTLSERPPAYARATWAQIVEGLAWARQAQATFVLAAGRPDGEVPPAVHAWHDITPDVRDAAIDQALVAATELRVDAGWCALPETSRQDRAWSPGPWLRSTLDPRDDHPARPGARTTLRGGRPILLEPGGVGLDLMAGARGPAPEVDWTSTQPGEHVLWSGARCRFAWYVRSPDGPVRWTDNTHEWPCGHARKLYGFKDNDPLWIHMAPDASACLSVYEHDTLLAPGLPVRWRDVGRGVALAERVAPSALFFQRADGDEGFPGDPLQADEDVRDGKATVTLGPSSDARYAVGLEAPTYRYSDGVGVRLGGPEDAWVVYDDQHRERARHRGRLLAGWDRWVVILRDDRLERVDLITDERTDLGPPGGPFTEASPIAGTPNVLLVHRDGDRRQTEIRVRLV